MQFDSSNNIVKACIQGMTLEAQGQPEQAAKLFMQAWDQSTNDFEKFIVAHFVARQQKDVSGKLKWLEAGLQLALTLNNDAVKPAIPDLHQQIGKCYEEIRDAEKAQKHYANAMSFDDTPTDSGPFYHGAKADLNVGDFLTPGGKSNYKDDLIMNHIYFTALPNGAGLAAALAKGEGHERVYIVEPTGSFENDPNVTNKKFPGNPTRSYRTEAPLKIVGEVTDWNRQTSDDVQKWKDKLANNKGEIIN